MNQCCSGSGQLKKDRGLKGLWRLAASVAGASLLLSGCATGMPEGVETVRGFELERYLGTWHEIARLDHRFERGLSRVTATYEQREDGAVRVINRGYDQAKKRWKSADGTAKLNGAPGEGRLKVSFFGPFYGAYNVIELDRKDYQYAMVCGPNRDYLWILAREPALDPELLDALIVKAGVLGFATDELIMVEHGQPSASP